MIKFYFQYDKDTHKAKVVMEDFGYVFYVDKVICEVRTWTRKQDESPKFVVEGECTTFEYSKDVIHLI